MYNIYNYHYIRAVQEGVVLKFLFVWVGGGEGFGVFFKIEIRILTKL